MKKNFFKFAAMIATVLSASAFVSCNEDEEDVNQITENQEIKSVKVFDRFGKQVCEMSGSEVDSVGGFNQPKGDYWYQMQYEGSDKVYSGHYTTFE